MIYLPRSLEGTEPQLPDHIENTEIYVHETILLVEDEEGILRMITEVLELRGYTVVAVENPFEAIRVARENAGEINLLITDVIMPEMNGRELAKTLDAIIPDLRTLFMSGYTDDVIAKHGVLDAETHFIHKPFTAKSLIGKVRQVLRQQAKQLSRLR
jgi:DNA-binding NtrC family response regulator